MDKGLEIVHLDFGPGWRGGQQQALLLAAALRTQGRSQLVVARGAVGARFAAAGFAVLPPGREAARRLRRAAVAHAHDGHAHGWLLRATLARRPRPLRVLTRRVPFPIRGLASRWKYHHTDLLIAVSHAAQRELLAAGVPAPRTAIIPDGVALAALPDAAAARAAVRQLVSLPPPAVWMVCLGAFTPEKGIADALAVLAALPPSVHLILPGEGPLRPALERQAARHALAARVHFTHDRGIAAADWVAAADLFLMPSRQEGLGSAALLAMALHRPIVATTAGGIPETLESGVHALLAAPGDVPGLAAACHRLLAEPALAVRLTAAAAARVQAYDITTLAQHTWAAYQAAAGGRR